MTVYLHDIPLPTAISLLETALEKAGLAGLLGIEEIKLDENALGRVLAEPVWAKISSPHYHASAMDGFAIRSSQTSAANLNSPITLAQPEEALFVDTGDPIPEWADAVIPVENVEPVDSDGNLAEMMKNCSGIRIRSAVTPWSHIRPIGEDMVATQLILPAGEILRPVDLGALAAGGHSSLRVAKRPRVAIIPTGSELVQLGEDIKPGDIIEYNSLVLAAQINQWGGLATRYSITPDHRDTIQTMVWNAAQTHDLVLVNAGTSAGSEDYSAQVIESLGEVLVHGIAVRPGHPVIIGMLASPHRYVPIIGVPGYPVSAMMTSELFVEPLLARWLGRKPKRSIKIQAKLTRKVTSPAGDDDYLRVAVGRVGDQVLAAPLSRGAGVITSMSKADGIMLLPRGIQGMQAGEIVDIDLYRSPSDINSTIFAIGSHDMILDILAQYLAQRGRRLVSANVGSQAGLVALGRGEAHLAGSHLLDPETGEYNLKYIDQYLPDVPVTLITLVRRQQGLIVQKGNPKHLSCLEDLFRADVVFINRQKGAGTRVLLDYHLALLGHTGEAIRGYQQEEYTHLAVAAAVASGRADCSLGIAAAARALNLDFIPFFDERYDLVIPDQFMNSDLLKPVFAILREPQFKQDIQSMPGYDTSAMGVVFAQRGTREKSISD